MAQQTKLISMTMAQELLAKVDRAAHEDYCSRSDFVRQALIEALQRRDTAVRNVKKTALNSMSNAELEEQYGVLAKEKQRRAIAARLAENEGHFRRPSAR